MTPIMSRRGRVRPVSPGDRLPVARPARRQCMCPLEHGTHVPGQCAHTVDDGPITTGCPCGTSPNHHQEVTS